MVTSWASQTHIHIHTYIYHHECKGYVYHRHPKLLGSLFSAFFLLFRSVDVIANDRFHEEPLVKTSDYRLATIYKTSVSRHYDYLKVLPPEYATKSDNDHQGSDFKRIRNSRKVFVVIKVSYAPPPILLQSGRYDLFLGTLPLTLSHIDTNLW